MALSIDVLILGLLVATIVYAFLVERRVRALTNSLRELEPMVMQFSNAVDRSESSVVMLRSAATDVQLADQGRPHEKPAQRSGTKETGQLSNRVVRVPAKSDLIRSFFENAKEGRQ